MRISFVGFGEGTAERLVSEIKKPGLSQEVQASLSGGITQTATHNDIPMLMSLLHDQNKSIAEAARDAVANNINGGDADLVRTLLKDPSDYVRVAILSTVNGRAWDERFVPILIDIIKNDPINRGLVVGILGHHKVKAAIPVFEAALNDPDPRIRRAAAAELKRISTPDP